MNSVVEKRVRGRLAPSPTGALHLGNARSLLLAWLSIRSRGGTVVLRMEDLDHPKVKPGAADQALADLRWLGLDWDEGPDVGGPYGPYVQSERTAFYAETLNRLQGQNLAYACVCSRSDVLSAQSAPHADDEGPRYPGTCRGRFPTFDEATETLPQDRLPAWRFCVPDQRVAFADVFCGELTAHVAERDGDFVLARHRDGAGYMLGVVVDDAQMQITEVLRGDDLIPATHRQILLYQALGWPPPVFVHVPLVVSTDGRRLAKRHGDTRLSMLKARGIPVSRVLGLLAYWCGWAEFGEACRLSQLVERFDMKTVPRSAVVLDDRSKVWLDIK